MKKPHLSRLFFLAALISLIVAACKNTVVKPSYSIDSSTSITAGYGDTITIRGTNLQSATGFTIVRLNGQIFSIVNSSDSYVQVRVPKFAGNGQFNITINGQTYNGPQFTYKYKAIVTTLAGSGTAGNADGKGAAASFMRPLGLAVDTGRNVFVADSGNHAVRKIAPDGTVTTISIPATIGGVNFGEPFDVAFNSNTHTLYAIESGVNVLQINNDNSIEILYTAASPLSGIAVGGDGSVYLCSSSTNNILQIGPGGQAPLPFADVSAPRSLVFDSKGALYAVGPDLSLNANAIFKISSTGVSSMAADDHGFKGNYIAADQYGNFFEADFAANTIRMVDKAGNAFVLAGSGAAADADGAGTAASFNHPNGIICDSQGNLYVSTFNPATGGGEVRKIVVE